MVSKKMLVALAAASTLGMSLSTVAATACNTGCPGVYVGAQAGWGEVKYRNHHEGRHHHDNGGFGGRVYLGYQFNPYVGLETGVAGFFKDSDHHHDRNGSHNNVGQWDLLARVGTPFGDSGFRGDLKGGAAYLFSSHDHHNHGHDHDNIIPAAGASLAYSFCHNVMVDVSYLHGFGTSHEHHYRGSRQEQNGGHHHHDSNRVKSTDLVTLGVSYLFPTL
ncbi:MAG: outer membrane beta-barrel protein [Gammaproteobacteria bacterium]|nr:outer membrane beta-barrel protein [Gammaproteobacteria bacterium]